MVSNQNEEVRIKQPTSFSEQVDILMSRGLIVKDKAAAEDILSRISYYRLSAYMLHYKKQNEFNEGVSIEDVYRLYEFDKKLRTLITGILESIEIAFRTQIAYTLAHKYGSTGYLERENFINEAIFKKTKDKLLYEIERSDEIFVQHHKAKYNGVFPFWVAIEVASFGSLSQMFSNLKNEDKSTISKKYYKLPHVIIRSWLHTLSTFRNKCAHHGRLYNRRLTIKPRLFSDHYDQGISNDQVFSILVIIKMLIKDESEWSGFVTNLEALIEAFDEVVDTKLMGFPDDWVDLLR